MATATNDTPTPETIGVELKGTSEILVATHDTMPPACFVDGERVATFPELSEAEAFAADLRKIARGRRVVAGVRALADFLEAHPEVDVRSVWASVETPSQREEAREHIALVANALDVAPKKKIYGSQDDIEVERQFADGDDVDWKHRARVELDATYSCKAVCDPEIVDGEVVWNLPEGLGAVGDDS